MRRPLLALVCLSLAMPLAHASHAQVSHSRDDDPPGAPTPVVTDEVDLDRRPAIGDAPVPYVIVTSRALAPVFRMHAHWRSRLGMRAAVRTIERIRLDYPVAHDDAERVRLFLRDAHDAWRTRYALLGGDASHVPVRRASLDLVATGIGDLEVLTDAYFACLDGTWDADADGRYGEPAAAGSPGDSADLDPDLAVGRAPVATRAEATRFVVRTLAYESDPRLARFDDDVLICANIGTIIPGTVLYQALSPPMARQPRVQLLVDSLPGLFDPPRPPGAEIPTRARILDALGRGRHIVVAAAPGAIDRVATSDGFVTSEDISALRNGSRRGHLIMLSASTNAFDDPRCLGRAWLLAPRGGGVSSYGPTNLEFVSISGVMLSTWLETLLATPARSLGEATQEAMRRTAALGSFGTNLLSIYGNCLLGDPALTLRRHEPVAVAAELGAWVAMQSEAEVDALPDPVVEPLRVSLAVPRPNPALESTHLAASISDRDAGLPIDVAVFDPSGRRIRTLATGGAKPGANTWTWDLRGENRQRVAPGLYLVRARMGAHQSVQRVFVTSP